MFHKFAERYLCAVYRMRQLKIGIAFDSVPSIDGRYARQGANRLDPLAFMLEGLKTSRNCYVDFAQDRAIPVDAMTSFRTFLGGHESKHSVWVMQNPVLGNELKHFAYGIFYCARENYQDSRYYFDLVDELRDKATLKRLITNPKAIAAKKPKSALPEQYYNRIW